LPGSSGSAGSSSDGNIIQRTSLASFNSPASLSSSGNFEIGSSEKVSNPDDAESMGEEPSSDR
jgi:hypothetical protein